jgi:hypothetical protein
MPTESNRADEKSVTALANGPGNVSGRAAPARHSDSSSEQQVMPGRTKKMGILSRGETERENLQQNLNRGCAHQVTGGSKTGSDLARAPAVKTKSSNSRATHGSDTLLTNLKK